MEKMQPKRIFLTEVQNRKLEYFWHIARAHNVFNFILNGHVDRFRTRGRVDLKPKGVGQMTKNGRISQLQIVSGLSKKEQLGVDWWGHLWSPTVSNEEGPRQGNLKLKCCKFSCTRKRRRVYSRQFLWAAELR